MTDPPADLEADLRTTVLALASDDEGLTEDAKLLVLEALGDGPEAPGNGFDAPAECRAAYLKAITVTGFRGVGPEIRVPLRPGPGLVVISGRNGSGKSTIAEALELALTGDSYRWRDRTAMWTGNWRNLHCGADAAIRLELLEEDGGPIEIGVDWASGDDLTDRSIWSQRSGRKREHGSDTLGWKSSLELYRPLLSYDELGGVFAGRPSELHDKMHTVLGLERITEAQQRLTADLKQLQAPQDLLRKHTSALKGLLAGSDDPRSRSASTLIAKHKKDISAVEALAVGSSAPRSEPIEALRRLTQLSVPTRPQVAQVAARLRTASADLHERSGTVLERSAQSAELLEQALTLHTQHGEQVCPVCGVGTLDTAWAERSSAALDAERAGRVEMAAARSALLAARREATSLLEAVPAPVGVDGFNLSDLTAAVTAHELWSARPADDLAMADHLEGTLDLMSESYAALRTSAAALITEHEDRWAPIAVQLATWVDVARAAEAGAPRLALVKQAADWLKVNAATLRNQRIAPLAERARHIWASLRQESSVDLGAIRLEGSATQRHVELAASVDGEEAGALGVMSQGELHALALALFLPRATAPQSPFRFIVLDDPIQAMDPSKVEGFVAVVAELAVVRQVIVLSHDDRLADAVRRSSLRAAMYEVNRGTGSVVTVRETLHPAMRYLDDADAITRDAAVPDDAKRRVVPGLCRGAVEAAAYEVYANRAHGRGAARVVVEDQWEQARTVKRRLGLALRAQTDADTMVWVKATSARSMAFHITNSGVHGAFDGNLADGIRDVRLAIKDLRRVQA